MSLAADASRSDRRAPYARDHDRSVEAGMGRGLPPKGLSALLRWFSAGWAAEAPTALHRRELWRDHGTQAEGGSLLGTHAWTDQARRYMENAAGETDQDGRYARPMHAAIDRMRRRWPLTARTLFALGQEGCDWQAIAERGHWEAEMFRVYVEAALGMCWAEHRDVAMRLD